MTIPAPRPLRAIDGAYLFLAIGVVVVVILARGAPRVEWDPVVLVALACIPVLVRCSVVLEAGGRTILGNTSATILVGFELSDREWVLPACASVAFFSYFIWHGVERGIRFGSLDVFASVVSAAAASVVDFGINPIDQAVVATGTYFTVLAVLDWIAYRGPSYLPTPLTIHPADTLILASTSVAVVALFTYIVALWPDGSPVRTSLTVVLTLMFFAVGQLLVARHQAARHGLEALQDAATSMPWPADDIPDLLLRYTSAALGAEHVAVVPEPIGHGVCVPLNGGSFLVAERVRGGLPFGQGDIQLAASFAEMAMASQKYADQENLLRREATTDHLTGLAVYPHFHRILTSRVDARLPDQRVVVFFADLDGFKTLNTELGHLEADTVLETIGARLLEKLPPTVTSARFGGDEFVFLADGLQRGPDVQRMLAQIYSIITDPIAVGERIVRVAPSLGVAVSNDPEEDPDEIVRRAETHMRERKVAGRRAPDVHDAKGVLERMIDDDRVKVAYQPIIDTHTGGLVGLEALLRTSDGTFGRLSPLLVVDSATRTHMLDRLTEAVVRQAVEVGRAAAAAAGIKLTLSFNLEFDQIRDHSDLISVLTGLAVDQDDVKLMVELSERVFQSWTPGHTSVADKLRSAGIGVAIDDFGAGFSTYALLNSHPWDWVKIDRSLLAEKTDDDRILLTHVADLLRALGRTVVAEGVETPEQMQRVADLGLDYTQGHWISQPLDEDDLMILVRSYRPVPFFDLPTD